MLGLVGQASRPRRYARFGAACPLLHHHLGHDLTIFVYGLARPPRLTLQVGSGIENFVTLRRPVCCLACQRS